MPRRKVEFLIFFHNTSCIHGARMNPKFRNADLHTSTMQLEGMFNPLQPNDTYLRRTAPLTSKLCILYIYSTNVGPKYLKYGIYSPFFPLQNAVCFIILTYMFHVLLIFYIQRVLKLKKK